MYRDKTYLKTLLLRYLNIYLSKKNLRMRWVLKSIKNRIEKDQPITSNQFNSVIKFIEREKEFVTKNRNQIIEFFEPLIEQRIVKYGNDLSEHFK